MTAMMNDKKMKMQMNTIMMIMKQMTMTMAISFRVNGDGAWAAACADQDRPSYVEDCFCHPQVMMESAVAAFPAKACPLGIMYDRASLLHDYATTVASEGASS